MKRFVLFIAVLALCHISRADWLAEATARYGAVDTGFSTKRLWSPEVAILDRFGDSGAHALGIAYSRYQWTDQVSYVFVSPPGSGNVISRADASAHLHWDCFAARYEYALKLTDAVKLRVGPGAGVAWAGQSNDPTNVGGSPGVTATHYSATSDARLLTEGRALLSANVFSNGVASVGVIYTHIESPTSYAVLARALSSTQAIASLGFSF